VKLPVVGKAHEAEAASTGFTWFIYGSSLDRDAFQHWAKEHGYVPPDLSRGVPSRLTGYRLAFDVMSRFWGGATASLVEDAGGSVEGLALPMPPEARGLVDHKEGAISGLYEPFAVEVVPLPGGAPIAAVAYRAAASRRLPSEAPPARAFVETLIRGAEAAGLTPGWIAQLRARL
jgi:hypothetical protein